MEPITLAFRPHPFIESPTYYRIFRCADLDDPEQSHLAAWEDVTDFIPVDEENHTFTDPEGSEHYWYRVQTCDDEQCAPKGYPLPGHGASSFCTLRAGLGWLSCVNASSVTSDELYDAAHEATQGVIEQYLEPIYSREDVLGFYREPLPRIRQLAEAVGAMKIVGQKLAHDEDQRKALQEYISALAGPFVERRVKMTDSLDVQYPSQCEPERMALNWDR